MSDQGRAGERQIRAVHKCPRCNGVGTTYRPPWVPGDQQTWTATGTPIYECNLCTGTGLVVLG